MLSNILYYIGRGFEYRKKWELAIFCYLKTNQDTSSKVNYRLGFCYNKRKDYGNAVYFLQKAIDKEPKKAHWYFRLANAYLGLNKEDLAAKYLKLGLKLDPNNIELQKKYHKISKKFKKGNPAFNTYLADIEDINSDYFIFFIEGSFDNEFDVSKLKLQINNRPNNLEDTIHTFIIAPTDIVVNNDGIYTAKFMVAKNSFIVDSNVISYVYDFSILADTEYRVQYYLKSYKKFDYKNHDFIVYSTLNKNLGFISVRTLSKYCGENKQHIVFTLGRIHAQTGVAKTTIDLANALANLNYNVSLVALDFTGAPNQFYISKKVNFSYVSCTIFRTKKQIFNFNSHKNISDEFIDSLYQYFSNINCDFIYLPIYGPKFLEAILNSLSNTIITILGEHTGRRYAIYDSLLTNKDIITLDKIIKLTKDKHFFNNIKNIDAIHIVNPLVEKIFNNITSKKILAIPNIVSMPEVNPSSIYKREKKIVLIGRLHKDKNFHIAIKVYKKLLTYYPNWSMEIYGTGEEEKSLITLIQSLNLKSENILKGFVSDINSVLSDTSIHLSLSNKESFGVTMVESMGNGSITISTKKTIGARYLIDNNCTGFLAEDNTEKSIYNILSQVISMIERKEPRLTNIQKDAYQKAKLFSMQNISKEWNIALDDLIRRKNLRNENKTVIEEDIIITSISKDDNNIIINLEGYLHSFMDINNISMEIKNRSSSLIKEQKNYKVTPKKIFVNNKNIFYAIFEISIESLTDIYKVYSNIVTVVWDFYLLENKKIRIKYFNSSKFIYCEDSFELIPYSTMNNSFSLFSINKRKHILNQKRPKFTFVISRIDIQTISTRNIINIANELAHMNYKVTIVALDMVSISNKIPISDKVNIEYISLAIHRDKQENIDFNNLNTTYFIDYKKVIQEYFSSLNTDILYMPIYNESIFSTIINSISDSIYLVVAEYSKKRYKKYNEFLLKRDNFTIEEVKLTMKNEYFFKYIDRINVIHITEAKVAEVFNKFKTLKVIISNINKDEDIKNLGDKLYDFYKKHTC